MKRYLIDTNVISETGNVRPNKNVMQWFDSIPFAHQYISIITLAELYKGIYQAKSKEKRQHLEQWVNRILHEFEQRIIPVDQSIASRFGEFLAEEKTLPLLDSMIAATALIHDFVVVTRNVRDFERFGVAFIDPWQ